MIFHETSLPGAYVIEPEKQGDSRGFFARVFCERELQQAGLESRFVQVNNSLSHRTGTLRGMHYQMAPAEEVKLVRCIRGALWDCIVDLRAGSETFGQWFAADLSAENRRMMYVPKGFAHGFMTLTADTEALYLVSAFYQPGHERGLRWNDPALSIDWPLTPVEISEKDCNWPLISPAGAMSTSSFPPNIAAEAP